MKRTMGLVACLVTLAPASLAWSQQTPGQQVPGRQVRGQQIEVEQVEVEPQGQRGNRGAVGNADQMVMPLATLLVLGNTAEIEIAQLATQKTDNEQVREFANKLVQDHTAYLQKLQQFNPQMGAANANRQRLEAAGERQQAAAANQQGQAAAGQDGQGRLLPILQQAAQIELAMTKETLSKYEGQDFAMAFLAQQVYHHVHMLAHLQAMKGAGSPEFQQVVEQGIQATTSHLQMAKQLAAQLEDMEGGQQSGQQSGQRDAQRGGAGASQPRE